VNGDLYGVVDPAVKRDEFPETRVFGRPRSIEFSTTKMVPARYRKMFKNSSFYDFCEACKFLSKVLPFWNDKQPLRRDKCQVFT